LAATNGAVITVFVVVVVMTYITKMLLPLMHGTGVLLGAVDPGVGVGVPPTGVPPVGEPGVPPTGVSAGVVLDVLAAGVPVEGGLDVPVAVPGIGTAHTVPPGPEPVTVSAIAVPGMPTMSAPTAVAIAVHR